MAIKREMSLAVPITKGRYLSLSGFDIARFHLEDDHVLTYLNPTEAAPVRFYPTGTPGVVEGRDVIVLGAQAFNKVVAMISAMEDAIKANKEFPWPNP